MTWLSNQRNKNTCDSQLNAKSVVNDIVVLQGKIPSSHHQTEIIDRSSIEEVKTGRDLIKHKI